MFCEYTKLCPSGAQRKATLVKGLKMSGGIAEAFAILFKILVFALITWVIGGAGGIVLRRRSTSTGARRWGRFAATAVVSCIGWCLVAAALLTQGSIPLNITAIYFLTASPGLGMLTAGIQSRFRVEKTYF